VPAFIAVLVAGAAASFLRARSKRGAECVGDAPLFAYTVSAPRLRQTDVAVLGREEVVRATEDQLSEDPSFSPDGTRIVFSSGRDGNFHPELGYERRALFTASSGGGEERRLTRGPYDAEPDWSPDGSAVFVRFRYGGRRDYESLRELRTVELWTVDIETREEQLLLRAPPRRGDAYRLYSPVWSPDGRRIAFSRATPAAHTLWLMDRDGSNVQQISEDIGSSYSIHPPWTGRPTATRSPSRVRPKRAQGSSSWISVTDDSACWMRVESPRRGRRAAPVSPTSTCYRSTAARGSRYRSRMGVPRPRSKQERDALMSPEGSSTGPVVEPERGRLRCRPRLRQALPATGPFTWCIAR
jgi:hypothetical protein